MHDALRALVQPLRVEVQTLASPIGTLTLVATARGLARLLLPGAPLELALGPLLRRHPDLELVHATAPTPWLEPGLRAVAQALGERDPELPALDLDVTDFERAVLGAISRIPRGQTRSYQQIASDIGRPQASRAVGQACGQNPLPILIPCHRVVGHGGGLTGFAGGTELKVQMLAREGVLLT